MILKNYPPYYDFFSPHFVNELKILILKKNSQANLKNYFFKKKIF
jgi:hypothetical protein